MKRSDEKGIALIITLLVVTLLTALIVEFAYSARVNLSAAGNFRDKQKAYYLAKVRREFYCRDAEG